MIDVGDAGDALAGRIHGRRVGTELRGRPPGIVHFEGEREVHLEAAPDRVGVDPA